MGPRFTLHDESAANNITLSYDHSVRLFRPMVLLESRFGDDYEPEPWTDEWGKNCSQTDAILRAIVGGSIQLLDR
jgi:hypothetical protein